jgi:hypothetical protein
MSETVETTVVRVVRPTMAEHRSREVRGWTFAFATIKGVATACAIFPAVNSLTTALVIAAIVAVVGGLLLRWVARRVRWWFEDRADARTAAEWRALHAPVLGTAAEPAAVIG